MAADDQLTFPDAPRAQLDRVLGELVTVAQDVLNTQGRLRALLRANQAVIRQLDLPVMLQTIVDVAVELVHAQYGALGVLSPHGGLEQFVHAGISGEQADRIGHAPEGRGLIGALIDDPQLIRLRHLTEDPRSEGVPAWHPPMDSFLGVPIRVRDQTLGNLYLANQESGAFSSDDEELLSSLAATAGFAIENARLFEDSRRRQAWTSAGAEVIAALLSSDDGDAVALLASRMLALTGANLVCVLLPTEHSEQYVVGTARGEDAERLEGARLTVHNSPLAGVLRARQPRLLSENEINKGMPPTAPHFGPSMAVPLVASGALIGVLAVCRAPDDFTFTAAELELAADLAGRAGVAIRLAAARADQQRMLLLEDRGRIARDLHDHVIQQLFATGLELQSVLGALPPGTASSRVNQAVENIDAAVSGIRTAIFAMSDASRSGGESVRQRVIDVVNELARQLPATPRIAFSGPLDLVATRELAGDLVAVVREALTNVVKHAHARQVTVSAEVSGDAVRLEVTDDGRGLSQTRRRSGLANLETRAKRWGGSFEIESGKAGTRLRWSAIYPEGETGGAVPD